MMVSQQTRAAEIQEMVSRIVRFSSPDKIILFGSHARGDQKPDSDIDLLVLYKEADDPYGKAAELYGHLMGLSVWKDIVVSTTAHFERFRDVVNTLYWPAAREGKVLFDAAA